MRNIVIDRQFQHLWIDQNQPALLGCQAVQQGQTSSSSDVRLVICGPSLPSPLRCLFSANRDAVVTAHLGETT